VIGPILKTARFSSALENRSTGRIQADREFHSTILTIAREVKANIEELEAAKRL
jgi:hypothetical protein